jgi:hypothetical protein
MSLILIVILLVVLFGGGYGWHRSGYSGGPYLGGGVGLILLVILVLALMGRI